MTGPTPHYPNNDRLIFSKGHACPLLYSMFKAAGVITDAELLSLRKFGSRLQGHPNPHVLPYVDVATGSLGQGLAIGVGMALNGKYLDKLPYRTWVLLGDSEMAEGSNWEAFDKASYYKLDHLIGILDMNRLGQRGPTDLGWDSADYAARACAFGWHAVELDGHDFGAIDRAYGEAIAAKGSRPSWSPRRRRAAGRLRGRQGELARQGLQSRAGKGRRRRAGGRTFPDRADRQTGGPGAGRSRRRDPSNCRLTKLAARRLHARLTATRWSRSVPTGRTWSPWIARFPTRPSPRSSRTPTRADSSRCLSPNSNCISAPWGWPSWASGSWPPRSRPSSPGRSTRSAWPRFRTLPFIWSAPTPGQHRPGRPSQMGLEDIAMMRTVRESTILYPCDPESDGHTGQRDGGPARNLLPPHDPGKDPGDLPARRRFPGGRQQARPALRPDQVAVIAAGITVHEALKAYEA